MKRSARALWCLAIAVAVAIAPAAAFADAGMEGLWIGEDMGGELTMMLGGGGAFIELRGDAYQAGTYLLAGEEMRLYYSDGTERAYLRDPANDVLALTDEDSGELIEMRRAEIDMPKDLVGVWTMREENGSVTSPGMVGMDAW
ncbi:MAG: hypothetical protein GX558_12130, partial [Clostridiales bacterium]|nr:hypothetical protein [Clostridiales bacterium]